MSTNNFLTDDSFFTYVSIPGQSGLVTLLDWFTHNSTAKFRLIQDEEADTDFLNLKDRLELYPGIKTFAIVTNPWARAKVSYDNLLFCKENKLKNKFLDYFNITSFESFVLDWPDVDYKESWFKLTTPQRDWIKYYDDNHNLVQTDFVLRADRLEEDFLPIKQFFQQEAVAFDYVEEYPNYRHLYNNQMKYKIGDIFMQDIMDFNFDF